jgi:hypothetical protein
MTGPPPLVIDPATFGPEAVSEATRAFNEALRERFSGPGLAELGVDHFRSGGLMPKPPRSPRGIDRTIPGLDGSALGAVQAFTAFPYNLAEEANARIDAFLKGRVAG